MTLEGEKAALDLQVKDLTFKLEMREGHITKKEVGKDQSNLVVMLM